jgi:hypothetical protein
LFKKTDEDIIPLEAIFGEFAKRKNLILTGHGINGSIAQVVSFLILQKLHFENDANREKKGAPGEYDFVKCVAFSPFPIGNTRFAEYKNH